MNPLELPQLDDVQARGDERGIAIDQVGIADLRYPVTVTDRDGAEQRTVADVAMDVDLAADVKGTHMSRFVEVLRDHADRITPYTVSAIAVDLRRRLQSQRARAELHFPYFRERSAPVTGLSALVDYEGGLGAEVSGDSLEVHVCARVPVTSLCPCSKEISDYGAHSQRGYVTLRARCGSEEPLWLDDLVEIAERAGSASIYPLLKRPDERYVTMEAYDNPAFVEDIARTAAAALRDDPRVEAFSVEASNQESIHNHSAVARIRWERPR